MMLYILLFCVFIDAVLITILISLQLVRGKPIDRLQGYYEETITEKPGKQRAKAGKIKEGYNFFINRIIKLFTFDKFRKSIDRELDMADIPLTAEEMLFAVFIAVFSSAAIFSVITHKPVIGLLMGLLVAELFNIFIREKKNKRLIMINEQLGDAIDMTSGCLRTGYSFLKSLEVAAAQMPLPISKEFGRVVKEVELGATLEKALENLLERVPIDDLQLIVTAVTIQRQIGGNLAEILDNISMTIRERIKLKRELRTVTAQERVSGYIIAVIPVFLIVILTIMDPQYLRELFTNRLGIIMICAAVINEIIGFIIIRKIINVQY